MTAAYVLVYSRDAAICDINRATETGIEMKATSLKKRITALVLAVSVVVTGYAQETKVDAPVADPQIKADQIQKEVAELRGLPFKRNVKAELQSLDDFGKYLDKALETEVPAESKPYYGLVVRKLGLYNGPIIENAPDMMKMIMTSQAGAYYDPDKQTFFVLMTKMPEMLLDGLFAHELHHGLQDQYFDLNKYFLTPARTRSLSTDETMARQAVVEGEATYMMTLWLMKRMTGSIPNRDLLGTAVDMQANMDMEMLRSMLKQPQVAETMGDDLKSALAAIEKIPPFMFDALMGAYMKGLGFVFAVEGHGWSEVEKLYTTKPPASMEQILHPEKWFAGETPLGIKLPAFSDRRLRDWELLDTDVIGEFRWRSIFKAQGLAADANELAAGWNGDRYAIMKRNGKSKDELLLLLYTAWDSEAEASQFAAGYRRLVANKYASASEPTRVVQKKADVLIVEGGSESKIDALVDWLAKAQSTAKSAKTQ
jgi:hypothetical protein